jgi:putative phosphoribosyl transferase
MFVDRFDGGRQLAEELRPAHGEDAVVVGLARGGVEVAAEIARALHLPLDALAVRKVGHPFEPEYAIGAVTPGGGEYLRGHDGLTEGQVASAFAAAARQADALDARLHADRPPISIAGKTCLLVDDGLATGATMMAAVDWARSQEASRVVVAVPVGAAETVARLREEADEVVTVEEPVDFMAVGFWYQDFRPVDDARVIALLEEVNQPAARSSGGTVLIPAGAVTLPGDLTVPDVPAGLVIFAHGSGSSRLSPRNQLVAGALNQASLATLLFDLLTEEESSSRENVFDIPLLASRLLAADAWARRQPVGGSPIGYFGASTGAAAALWAAAELGTAVSAVVSRGGRPDLAGQRLPLVTAPTQLIVGSLDDVVIGLNREAAKLLSCKHELAIVPGATHLFEEPGALEIVAEHATRWFSTHLAGIAALPPDS